MRGPHEKVIAYPREEAIPYVDPGRRIRDQLG